MAIQERTIVELLEDLKVANWTDVAIGEELGVRGQTVWRWRNNTNAVIMPKLIRRTLIELLARA